MTNSILKLLATGASAAAIATVGFSANAQEITDREDAATSAQELNQIQLAQLDTETTTSTSMQSDDDWSEDDSTDKDWSDKSGDKSWDEKKMKWNTAAKAALNECVAISDACNVATTNAAGVLVFPELTSASFIVGGTGGNGVLMVDGEPAGYYNLAAGSLGFQVGIEQVSQVMTFNSEAALNDLTSDTEWRAGADANVTVINTGANAQAIADGDLDQLGEVSAIAFNQEGLSAGVSIEGIRLAEIDHDDRESDWKEDTADTDEWSDDEMDDTSY